MCLLDGVCGQKLYGIETTQTAKHKEDGLFLLKCGLSVILSSIAC